jgi:hypothetical protein
VNAGDDELYAKARKYGRRARFWSWLAIAFAVASIVINIFWD